MSRRRQRVWWTDEILAECVQKRSQGMPPRVIAKKLGAGFTGSKISAQLNKLKSRDPEKYESFASGQGLKLAKSVPQRQTIVADTLSAKQVSLIIQNDKGGKPLTITGEPEQLAEILRSL